MPIPSWIAGLIVGPLIDTVIRTIHAATARKLSEAELRTELRKAIVELLEQGMIAETHARRSVLLAELRGESRLQRLWRPLVALSFAFVLVFYALVLPIAVDWFGLPPVRVGDALLGWVMTSVNIAIGGYIGGRSLEKVVRLLRLP